MKTIGMLLSAVLFFSLFILNRAQSKNNYINNESNNVPKHTSPFLPSFDQVFKKQIKNNSPSQDIFTKAIVNFEKNKHDITCCEESETYPSSTSPCTTIYIYHNNSTSKAMHYQIPFFDLSDVKFNLPKKE